MRLNRTLADQLTTREVVIDQVDGEDVTVKIRPVGPDRLLEIFKGSKGLLEMSKDDVSNEDLQNLLDGGFNLSTIGTIVREVLIDPVVVDKPEKDNEVCLADISMYSMKIFHAAMDMSGFGQDVQTFRGNTNSDSGSPGGEGVRQATLGAAATEREPAVGTTV